MSERTEAAIVRAAMKCYSQRLKRYPVDYAKVIAGDDCGMDKDSAILVRACHAHAHATKGKR
jgi:hypothetical protein